MYLRRPPLFMVHTMASYLDMRVKLNFKGIRLNNSEHLSSSYFLEILLMEKQVLTASKNLEMEKEISAKRPLYKEILSCSF